MAKDTKRGKTFWDDDSEETKTSAPTPGKNSATPQRTGAMGPQTTDQVEVKLHEAETMLDQIHRLYQHYFNGVEKRPPADRARLLETRVKEIERFSVTTTASKFKLTQFITKYRQFRELWDRKLRELEK
jgi:hypothetical protein